jgi:hypothetical protein
MFDVLADLHGLYDQQGITTSPDYDEAMRLAIGNPALAYATPAMFGVTATVLSSRRMVAYNLTQNAIDEAKGAARIQIVADRYAEPELHKKMTRHVGEELKHSRQFKQLVTATGYGTMDDYIDAKIAEEVLDFDDDLKSFVCRVHSIEIRSWTVLRMYQQILAEQRFADLSETALPVLANNMVDEINHVVYTGAQIDAWLREDPGLRETLDECLAHTNRETWQDIASMTTWLADNFEVIFSGTDVSPDFVPASRFLVGDLTPEVTLT